MVINHFHLIYFKERFMKRNLLCAILVTLALSVFSVGSGIVGCDNRTPAEAKQDTLPPPPGRPKALAKAATCLKSDPFFVNLMDSLKKVGELPESARWFEKVSFHIGAGKTNETLLDTLVKPELGLYAWRRCNIGGTEKCAGGCQCVKPITEWLVMNRNRTTRQWFFYSSQFREWERSITWSAVRNSDVEMISGPITRHSVAKEGVLLVWKCRLSKCF